MENIIYNELRFQGFNVDVGVIDVSEKTEKKDVNGKAIYAQKALEIDFIATLGDQKYYIQSALSMDDPQKAVQEKRSLDSVDDSFKKIVITKSGLNVTKDDKGVMVVDLFEFLQRGLKSFE